MRTIQPPLLVVHAHSSTVVAPQRTFPLLRDLDHNEHPEHMAESGLTREKAIRFQRLVRDECGLELTVEEARTRASRLIALYRMLMAPIPEDPESGTSASGSNLDHLA